MTAILTLLLNPRFLAAAGLVAALAGAYLYVDHRAFKRGADATEARWQAREARSSPG
jgi:expansin (peptidoglycan-binding protein)